MYTSKEIWLLLKEKKKITIGRPGKVECDVVFVDASVSRPHCQLEWIDDEQIRLTDLNSKNHTYVNGLAVKNTSVIIHPKDVIVIGNQVVVLKKGIHEQPVALSAKEIAKVYPNRNTGLQPCNIEIQEGAFVAIMGPSGCGKSTLLKALTGADPATQGKIEIFGIDMYRNYSKVKEMIGFVPQDDIVHPELTVEKALTYAYYLRSKGEVDKNEMEQKIHQVLQQLNLKDEKIRTSKIAELSGGQRKRISIAIELLSEPKILFLDEPTSPLDPETIEEFLKCLELLTESGTTVIMVTHKPEDLSYVHQVIWLANGGHLVFQGEATQYLTHFEKKNAVEVYSLLYDKENGKKWQDKWNSGKRIQVSSPSEVNIEHQGDVSMSGQFKWLTLRYCDTKINDTAYTILLMMQAPVIAILIGLIFDRFTLSVLFLMNLTALWLGSSNAAREIVRELPVYQRERMYNLRLIPYVCSKLVVLTFFSFVQILIFTSILYAFYAGKDVGIQHFTATVFLLTFVAFSAIIIGLLLSSVVKNSEQAIALLPLLLIPQIILSGVIYPIDHNSFIEMFSILSLGRNGTAALTTVQQTVEHIIPVCDSIPALMYAAGSAVQSLSLPDTMNIKPDRFGHLFAVMSILNALTLLAVGIALKKKDRL